MAHTEPSQNIDVDLSPFSAGKLSPWLSGPGVVLIIFGWFFFLLLIASVRMGGLAAALGGLTFLVIVAGFVATLAQRLSRSTTGVTLSPVRPEDLGKFAPHFDAPLGEILAAVGALKRPDAEAPAEDVARSESTRASRRLHSILYVVAGVLLLVLGLPLIFMLRLGGALLGPAVILLVVGVFALFTRSRRVTAPSAEALTRNDRREPILFLRSFQDDKVTLRQRVRLAGVPAVQSLRFEEALGAMVGDFGPFLAVGEPGEGLPQLGAARAYLPDDQWQAAVLDWIGRSRLITMLCGPTHWIHWEMQTIIAANRLDRLLLLLPPGRKPASRANRRRLVRWENILKSLDATPCAAALRSLNIDDVLLVQFRGDNSLRVFRSQGDLAQDYELAVTLAIYAALRDGDHASPGASPVARPAQILPDARPLPDDAASVAAARDDPYLPAKMALFGLGGGVIAALLSAPGVLERWMATPLRSFLLAGAATLGGRLLLALDRRSLAWLFGVVALSHLIATYGAMAMRAPFGVLPIAFCLLLLAGMSVRFRGFRRPGVWVLTLAGGVAVAVLTRLGLHYGEGPVVSALRFLLAPWAAFTACIGFGLAARRARP